jgi:hypothetical protein
VAIRNSTTLKTAAELVLRRMAAAEKAAQQEIRAIEWAARLDADAYCCHRDGSTWIAEGPADQRFEFTLIERFTTGHATIGVKGMTGQYQIWAHCPGQQVICSCPAFQRSEDCKHAAAFRAVKRAAQDRHQQPAPLPLAA